MYEKEASESEKKIILEHIYNHIEHMIQVSLLLYEM